VVHRLKGRQTKVKALVFHAREIEIEKMQKNVKKLYKHQQRFADKNPDRAMLVWETGVGKSISACVWMNARPNTRMLLVCPKGIIGKWKRDLIEWGVTNADIASRDEVKKIDLSGYGGLVLDEAQDFASPLFTKQRSERASVIYDYVRTHMGCHILLLTATPVRSTPWNIHTLACYLGIYWERKEFQNEYFYMTNKFGRMHYEKKNGWQKMIRERVEQISDIVLMSDCVDVPQQHLQTIKIAWSKTQEKALQQHLYMEPSLEWHARHRMEQGEPKWKELKKLIDGYRKVIVVCHYRSQIDDYAARIGSERQVFVLNGDTKDQDAVIEGAKDADDCIFIIQAQMGAGFDAGEFSVVIFASMSFRYVDYVQMRGRVKRINNLHENTFIHLIGGKNDKAVYDAIQSGKDFDVHEQVTGTSKEIEQARSEDYAQSARVVSGELPF
jgi:superfamily II DNA or RNA helicase